MTQNSLSRGSINALRQVLTHDAGAAKKEAIGRLCDMALAYLDHLASPSATGDTSAAPEGMEALLKETKGAAFAKPDPRIPGIIGAFEMLLFGYKGSVPHAIKMIQNVLATPATEAAGGRVMQVLDELFTVARAADDAPTMPAPVQGKMRTAEARTPSAEEFAQQPIPSFKPEEQ